MRFSIQSLIPSLLLATSISAGDANVYLFNGGNLHQSDSESLSTSASNARLVFAQRLDVAQYHSLQNADADAVQVLNEFGGRPRKLFNGDINHNRPKALLVVEGVENVQDLSPTVHPNSISSFRIQDPPAPSANARLLQDISSQAKTCNNLEYSHLFYDEASRILRKVKAGEKASGGLKMSASNGRVLAHLTILEQISSRYGSSSAEYKSATASIREAVNAFFDKAANDDWEVILVTISPPKSSGIFRRSAATSWGSYSIPKRQDFGAPESGRPDVLPNDFGGTETNVENPPANEIDFDEFLDPNEPQQTEDTTVPTHSDIASHPDSEAMEPETKTGSHGFTDTLEEFIEEIVDEIFEFTPGASAPAQLLQDNYTAPPLGILPTCYTTYNACVSTTHNCSGHGSCYIKFTDEKSDYKRPCFVCGCTNTYRRDSNGGIIKTTQWAGPACQKKDVSMPFWLLGGVTVLLMGIIAWGIGLLISMGSEELPSVIGAGVAGPRAK